MYTFKKHVSMIYKNKPIQLAEDYIKIIKILILGKI